VKFSIQISYVPKKQKSKESMHISFSETYASTHPNTFNISEKYWSEVKMMNFPKGWPFEPLTGIGDNPCGGESGGGSPG
jgi:hypothetical protein